MENPNLFPLTIVTLLTGCANQDAASVGVIGGADRPTAIFIAGKSNWFAMISGIIIVVVAILAIIYFIKRKK